MARNHKQPSRITTKCEVCNRQMPPKPKCASNWIYCSDKCRSESRQRKYADKFQGYRYKHYGILDPVTGSFATKETFDRFLKEQNLCCALCEQKENLCMDHDHVTMYARGLLCNTHNRALGYFGDDKAGLRKAIAYLSKS